MAKRLHAFKGAPPALKVKVLCKDPLVQDRDGLGPVEVKFEGESYLGEGPTTARVAVVDYDADLDQVFAPVQVLATGRGFTVGSVANVRNNFAFHQVNVWAVVNRTVALLEDARMFGRPIPWASGLGRLLILPHAGYGQNAFYDRNTGALHFLYFEGKQSKPVFTCLSHDIVTHELGHAVLDGLKPLYNEVSSVETAAFHEYFGDALALTASLTFREILVRAVGKAPLELDQNLIGKIGEEFGNSHSVNGVDYLRAAFEKRTLAELRGNFEEHEHSQVLTNAFYELLAKLYVKKLKQAKELLHKKTIDGQVAVNALINAANQTSRMMFRGIDYCPPVDVGYVDYARAVLASDRVAYPSDDFGGRKMLAEIFVARGIGRSVKELLEPVLPVRNRDLRPYDVDKISSTPSDAYRFLDQNREKLLIPQTANLGIRSVYRTKKSSSNGYFPPQEIILEFFWSEDVKLEGKSFGALAGKRIPMPCGGTLVFDRNGNVLHYVVRTRTDARVKRLREYVAYLVKRGRIGEPGRSFDGHPIVAKVEGEKLTLERVASLRHERRNVQRRAMLNAPTSWEFPRVKRVNEPRNLSATDWAHLREALKGPADEER